MLSLKLIYRIVSHRLSDVIAKRFALERKFWEFIGFILHTKFRVIRIDERE